MMCWPMPCGLPNGYGKLELEEKGVYKGGVANGKPHGMGQHIMPDGATYWGIWEDGCFGRLGGGVGVWHYATSDTTVHGMWYEGSDLERAPVGNRQDHDGEVPWKRRGVCTVT